MLAVGPPALCLGILSGLVPGRAAAEDVLLLRDGRVARVERAEELPDRVRVQTGGPAAAELPRGLPFTALGARAAEVPRREVLAVFPVPDLPGAARPHLERYGDLAVRLAEQARRDLQQSWSTPPSPRR